MARGRVMTVLLLVFLLLLVRTAGQQATSVRTLAGDGVGSNGGTDVGVGSNARFAHPVGVAVSHNAAFALVVRPTLRAPKQLWVTRVVSLDFSIAGGLRKQPC